MIRLRIVSWDPTRGPLVLASLQRRRNYGEAFQMLLLVKTLSMAGLIRGTSMDIVFVAQHALDAEI
jgi:hypothetical protein